MPPTSTAILAASCDPDLLDRATAIAALHRVSNPVFTPGTRALVLAVTAADDTGATVAEKYGYAADTRRADLDYARAIVAERKAALAQAEADLATVEAAIAPGVNPAAVTDQHLAHAVTALIAAGVLRT